MEEINLNQEPTSPATPENKNSLLGNILDYVELFVIAVLAVLILFSFGVRVCTVDGESMRETLQDRQQLLTTNFFYTPSTGDIIVFQETEVHDKPLVKRVIATGGQHLQIDPATKTVKVDGVELDEDYVYLIGGSYYNQQPIDIVIPDGWLFVMGDNRNNSDDSRNNHIGVIHESQIIGKVILRFSPFTKFD